MNLEIIFKAQTELDTILMKKVIKQNEKNFEIKRGVALLVELGEFANEVKAFKYWKKHKEMNRDKVLEEFADGIHFLTSISLSKQVKSDIKIISKYDDFSLQLSYVYKLFTNLLTKCTKNNVKKAYGAYLGLGLLVNIGYNEIITSYLNKNKINYERIENNY
ncbi:dUTP diphosphatase [Metamycoplasma buccale]|uniref:dUTP diphosphatase n=1 Tax=Metamycoplasma buccale TaxID=55602 RepID=UPI00398E4CD7